GCR
ncbi:hypothetical protein J1605_018173, partial [Eschrichtius robustus]